MHKATYICKQFEAHIHIWATTTLEVHPPKPEKWRALAIDPSTQKTMLLSSWILAKVVFLNVCAAKRQSQPQQSADLRFFTSSKLSLPMSFLPLPTVSVSTSLFFIYVLIFAPQIHNTSIAKPERRKKKEKEMEI